MKMSRPKFSKNRISGFLGKLLSGKSGREITYKNKYVRILADYYSSLPLYSDFKKEQLPNIRKCVELPWQQVRAGKWDELVSTLCNLDFIQAKASANLTFDLVKDFNSALMKIPDNSADIREVQNHNDLMKNYINDLILYARQGIPKLIVPESVKPWSRKKTEDEIEKTKKNPSRLNRLKNFYQFLGQEVGNFYNHINEVDHLIVQQAWNFAMNGPVGQAADETDPGILSKLFLLAQPSRPQWNPYPMELKRLTGHTESVSCTDITPDGKLAISGSGDKTCILWNLETGEAIKNLNGHTSWINTVAITPDGKKAISSGNDNNCIFWDLESGQPIRTLEGHTNEVVSLKIAPDGKQAISGTSLGEFIIWDLETF
jgi:WD40 repeat protein